MDSSGVQVFGCSGVQDPPAGAREELNTATSSAGTRAEPLSADDTRRLALEWGLTEEEYASIEERLGRLPTVTEVAMFSVEWCEHCGYPKSRRVLGLLPKESRRVKVLVGADTGGFQFNEDLAVVMKVESHNHPSQVEPFQGAATGVGGILRDIFTVGARPIASANSLRFGDPQDPYTQYLVDGVVRGIAHYGNCLAEDELFVWRDASGVHFDTIGRFIETRMPKGVDTADLDPALGIETRSLDVRTMRACWRAVRRLYRRRATMLTHVRTALGRSLTVTSDHPMLVQDKGGWHVAPAGGLQIGDQIPVLTALPPTEGSALESCAPFDLIEAWGKLNRPNEEVYVALPAGWRPTTTVRHALRAVEPSIQQRFKCLKAGRFPLQHFLRLEPVLGVSRCDVALFRRGKANRMRAVVHPDEAFARLLGYYVSEGCVSQNANTYKVIFTFARHEAEYVEDVRQALASLGLRVCIETRASSITVYATSWLLGHVLKDVWKCGVSAHDKALPAFVFSWPCNLQREVLRGVLRGDGSLTTRTHGNHAKITFCTTSQILFEQTLALVQSQGAVPGVYVYKPRKGQIQGRQHLSAPSWSLEVCNYEGLTALKDTFGAERTAQLAEALGQYQGDRYSFPRFKATGDVVTVKVSGVQERAAEDQVVYDVEVEDTHLFATTSGILTHNCTGVPTVAGEVYFHPSYQGNCLVNALSVGVVPLKKLASAAAAGPGNPVVYVGSSTGRDGIGGCSVLASHEFGEGEEKRPTVQIGDPFTEKCLIEACLEAIDTGAIVAMKDMGAAGVTCTTSEMAAAGGVGMRVELQRIPRRETGMEPYEVMMSESQERMLLVAERGREQEILDVFRKWSLQAVVIGEVTDDGMLTILDGGETVAHVSAELLTTPPKYDMPAEEPSYLATTRAFDPSSLQETMGAGEALLRLLGSPNLCSRRWIYEQYDHSVQTNTVVAPGADAAVLRIKEAGGAGVALTIDGNSRWVYLDPYEGARLAVAEAARNLSCVGAEPAIVTDGLNFGNPDKPDRYWQFRRAVEGIADACRALDLPVVSGNVSFYNESPEGPIHPTPIIGMLGTMPDVSRHATLGFKAEGDLIYRVGPDAVSLGGSEYLAVIHGQEAGCPTPVEMKLEARVQSVVRALIREGLVQSAHDCAEGGLAVALAESCIAGRIGARIEPVEAVDSRQKAVDSEAADLPTAITLPAGGTRLLSTALFGEGPSRIVISIRPEARTAVEARLAAAGVPGEWLGTVGGPTLVIGDALDVAVSALEETWERTLPETMAPGRQQPSATHHQ